jgi:hypothetical protein
MLQEMMQIVATFAGKIATLDAKLTGRDEREPGAPTESAVKLSDADDHARGKMSDFCW